MSSAWANIRSGLEALQHTSLATPGLAHELIQFQVLAEALALQPLQAVEPTAAEKGELTR